MTKITTVVIVTLIILVGLGAFLRFYKNTENPPSLTGDEISFGYAAYSILKTGRDESGKYLPLVIESIGDYKNPVPAYLMVLSIKLFGLNDFAVRFQNALIGTLFIPVYFFFLNYILKNKLTALLGTFFLSISAWHIHYSRFAYEPAIASFFALLGIWFFMKMLDGRRIWGFLSAFFLVLTMYTGFAPRLFIPIFVLSLLVFYSRKLKTNLDKVAVFLVTCLVLGLPLVYVSFFQGAATRLNMVFIANDIEFVRYVIFKYLDSASDIPYLVFFWLKRYLNYLQPDFLFVNGLAMTTPGTFGLGLLYIFELPWLVLGVVEFIKQKIPYKEVFVVWVLTGIIPDSLTNNLQHSGRLLHIAPVIILFTTLGCLKFFKIIMENSRSYLRVLVLGVYSAFIVLVLTHAYLVFSVHFPRQKGEAFDEGIREAVLYITSHQESYKEIVFDTRRGVEGPYFISNPHMYLLFYSKYDPQTYQTESKIYGKDKDNPLFKFNKYTFRYINWPEDAGKKGTLFMGSPWSFPEKLKEGELLEKIYLTNGHPAFYIVSPK